MGGTFPEYLLLFPIPALLKCDFPPCALQGAGTVSAYTSKVSLGCPCSVPVSLLGVTELQAPDRPWCTTSMEEMWLGISATIAPLCLGESPALVRAGEAAWPGHMGTAQRQPGCPFSPKRQLVSLGPLPTAVPTARTSYSCWIGPDNLELKGFQGLSQDSSMASQEASLQDPRGV